MNSKQILYHGSPYPLKGKTLDPSQGEDLEERPDNKVFAVFATDIKEIAITMGIISAKGVIGGGLDSFKKPFGILYGGVLPKQKYIYVHHLSKKDFKKSPKTKHQFVCPFSVKPIKTEKIEIKKYLSLVKIATKEETQKWEEKYNFN